MYIKMSYIDSTLIIMSHKIEQIFSTYNIICQLNIYLLFRKYPPSGLYASENAPK